MALFIVAGFIGQVAILFPPMGQTEKRQAQSEERAEMNQRLSDMDASIRQLNPNHIEHLTHHG